MGKHDPLLLATGAAGVDEAGQIIRLQRRPPRLKLFFRILIPTRHQIVKRQRAFLATKRHNLQVRHRLAHGQRLLQQRLAANDEQPSAAIGQDVLDLHRWQARKQGDIDRPGAGDAEVAGDPVGAVFGDQGDAVTGLHAERGETTRHPPYALPQLLVADRLPLALLLVSKCGTIRKTFGVLFQQSRQSVIHALALRSQSF